MNEQALTLRQYYYLVLKPKLKFLYDRHSFFYYVLTLLGCALLFFGFALITQKFTTPYSGDYCQQGIPFAYNFYDSWWTFFKTGRFPLYDENVMLGADNITANTFYGIFSPFVFPMLFFPRSWIPQLVAFLEIARLVIGGLLFRKYLKYLGVSENTSRLFSIAYAFTGWTAYILWFNSFYEVATFFPMVLWGIERCIKERKIDILSSGLFLLGISNYFFFITAGVFGVIYALFRFFQTIKTRNIKQNLAVMGLGVLGFAVGFGMTASVCLPAILSSMGMARAESSTYLTEIKIALESKDFKQLFELIFKTWHNPGVDSSDKGWAIFYPIASFFFPNASCRFVNIFRTNFDNYQSSIFLYTPMMIMFFASMYRSLKNKKISHFIAIAMVCFCLFTPFFYQLCGFFSIGYGRWEIVVPLVALAYIAINYDHKDEIPLLAIIVSGVVCLLEMLMLIVVAERLSKQYEQISDIGAIYALIIYEIVVCIVTTGLLAKFWKKKYLNLIIHIVLAIEIGVMGTVVANVHSLLNYDTQLNGGYINVPNETKIIQEIINNDDSYFRLQNTRAYEGNDNLSMVEGYNGVSTFHSFYNTEINDFCVMSQVLKSNNTWVGSDFLKRANLEQFLGVKYYVSKESETTYTYGDEKYVFNHNIPLQYERIDNDSDNDGYRVYKNKYQINFATSYDTIYLKNECSGSYFNNFYSGYQTDVIRNEESYFKGAILNNDDAYEVCASSEDLSLKTSAPIRDAKKLSTNISFYLPKENFDPRNPYRDLIPENKISTNANIEQKDVNRLQIVIDCASFPSSDDGIYYMIDYPVRSYWNNYNSTVFAVCLDEFNNPYVETFDSYRYNSRDNGTAIRGLSVKNKIDKIIICANGTHYRNYLSVYYEDYKDVFNRYNEAINNAVKNVTKSVDKFEFDTDYEQDRFVITQVAYTKGWKISAIDENGNKTQLKTYNAQGGFVGFVAPKGNYHYEMTYFTPYLKEGLIISITSFVLFVGTSTGIVIYNHSRKNKKEFE